MAKKNSVKRAGGSSGRSENDRLAMRILWGMVIGVGLGLLARLVVGDSTAAAASLKGFAQQVLDPVGQVFLRLLFFVVIPLVFASLAAGVARLGNLRKLGPLAGSTFGLFFLNMALGVGLGLLMMNIVQPGAGIDPSTREALVSEFSSGAREALERSAQQREQGFGLPVLVDMFMPRNILKAVVEFQILPLILFALLIGAAATESTTSRREQFVESLDAVTEFMTRIVGWALKLAPIAVAALLMSATLKFGVQLLKPLAVFVVAVLGVMAIHLFGVLRLILAALSKRGARGFYAAVRTVLVTAFSTSSSSATLPTSIKVSEEQLGVSPSVAGFVLPLGATMNMSGTSLYEGCVVLFIAQVYGIDLSLIQQMTLLLMAVLSAVAVAGIPGASLPLIVGMMVTFGIPGEGIALILGVDRILDMARTCVNVGADLVTAVIVQDRVKLPTDGATT